MVARKKEVVEEGISIKEKIEALNAWHQEEGMPAPDFQGDDAEVERRYAQLEGLPTPEIK